MKHSLKVGQKRKRLDRDSTTPSGDEHSVGSGGDPTINGKKKKVRSNLIGQCNNLLIIDFNDHLKVRTTFTGRQIFELEKMFENRKYLSSSERADMAKLLNVTEQQVNLNVTAYVSCFTSCLEQANPMNVDNLQKIMPFNNNVRR